MFGTLPLTHIHEHTGDPVYVTKVNVNMRNQIQLHHLTNISVVSPSKWFSPSPSSSKIQSLNLPVLSCFIHKLHWALASHVSEFETTNPHMFIIIMWTGRVHSCIFCLGVQSCGLCLLLPREEPFSEFCARSTLCQLYSCSSIYFVCFQHELLVHLLHHGHKYGTRT